MLFCCNYNSIRSPMAEGIFKKLMGRKIFVQSAGIFDTLEIDGFTIKVCDEINVKLRKHRVRSLGEMEKEGGFIGSFDLIIALTKESSDEAHKYSTYSSVIIEDWSVEEPIKHRNDIVQTLASYRKTRDIIFDKIKERFQGFY
ncbi:low molecular weight phosphatase family protein [Paracoccaceae bacterium]|nr:low molecular weight phosphatase family protein [Paracoccaceae bacterium]